MSEEKRIEQKKKILQVEIARIRNWIERLEARANELLEYNVENMTADGRETAISKHLLTMGRFTELARNFEMQLDGGEDDEDNPQRVYELTHGKVTVEDVSSENR